MQYRSGPRGFLHHLGGNRIGFADFVGNNQFATVGNLDNNGRVSLFIADFPRKLRLKVFGTARVIEAADDPALFDRLMTIGNQRIAAKAARSIVIDVEAFDWNCSRSLIPQYDGGAVAERIKPYADEITRLRAEVDRLRRMTEGRAV